MAKMTTAERSALGRTAALARNPALAEVAKSEEIIQRQRAEMGVSMRNHQEKLAAAVEAKTVQGKPPDVCPHGVEFRFCRMLMCKPPAEDGFIRRMEGKK